MVPQSYFFENVANTPTPSEQQDFLEEDSPDQPAYGPADDEHNEIHPRTMIPEATQSYHPSYYPDDPPQPPTCRVRFGKVQTREFAVIIGDVSSGMKDACPLTLDWEYRECREISLSSANNTTDNDNKKRSKPRKLSLSERRERVARVQGITSVDVHHMELAMVLHECRNVMQAVEAALAA